MPVLYTEKSPPEVRELTDLAHHIVCMLKGECGPFVHMRLETCFMEAYNVWSAMPDTSPELLRTKVGGVSVADSPFFV